MKNVIVLHNPGASAEFLSAQGLLNPTTGQNKDSSALNELENTFRGMRKDLQSSDGIQFYQFKQKYPRTNPGQFLGPEHLEYWTQALSHRLHKRRGEKLDAIVIPEPEGQLDLKHLQHWLSETRAEWPDLKVLVLRPKPGSGYATPAFYETLPAMRRRPGDGSVRALEIPPGIDMVVEAHNNQAADLLRELIDMPRRSQQPRSRV